MTDRQRASEINQRRQVFARISELKSSCESLGQIRDNLLDRLSGLNEVVDRLIIEKKRNKYDPDFVADLAFNRLIKSTSNLAHNRDNQSQPPLTSTFATNDLTSKDNLLYRRQQITPQSAPSEAYKIKLSLCLQEVVQKAEEIAELSEHLHRTGNSQ